MRKNTIKKEKIRAGIPNNDDFKPLIKIAGCIDRIRKISSARGVSEM